MDSLLIRGGRRLEGRLEAAGAKNAALPILCAALLTADPVELHNVPNLHDIRTMCRLISLFGASVQRDMDLTVIDAGGVNSTEAPYDLVRTMRASILVLGPLLARFGQARVSLPGGCAIGQRPVDQHIRGFQAMGAEIQIENGYIEARASTLRGARIVTDMVTVTGTENLMMAACLAQGETVIENAAREPEIVDLARLLVSMGARIDGAGTDRICIQGVARLHGASHSVMPDRIEVGTFLCAVAACGGSLRIDHADPMAMDATLMKLREAGAQIDAGDDWLAIRMDRRPMGTSIRTAPYPGFATDMQAQFMTLNVIADGTSVITETIFENRFMHVQELLRLGADIHIEGNTAVVRGVAQLSGATVMATDLRASASLVIAGLAARGQTRVERVYHLDRGYAGMELKLAAIGADIQRVSEDGMPVRRDRRIGDVSAAAAAPAGPTAAPPAAPTGAADAAGGQ